MEKVLIAFVSYDGGSPFYVVADKSEFDCLMDTIDGLDLVKHRYAKVYFDKPRTSWIGAKYDSENGVTVFRGNEKSDILEAIVGTKYDFFIDVYKAIVENKWTLTSEHFVRY